MAEDGHEESVRVAWVDHNLCDLLPVAQAEMGPVLSGVGGAVDAVSGREVGALQSFATADIEDVGVGGCHGDGADRTGGLLIEDRLPGDAVIGALPDPTVGRADIKDVRLRRHAHGGLGTAAPEGTNHPPAQLTEW